MNERKYNMLGMLIRKLFILGLFFVVCLFTSCIKNDLPFPVIKLEFLDFEVEGQNGSAVIDRENQTVTVDLQETVDLKNVKVLKCEVTEGIESPLNSTSVINLSQPQEYILSLYQDYKWTIKATQNIERRFTIENQIGSTICNETQKQIFSYVKKDADLKKIGVVELKLGPEGITTYEPELKGIVNFAEPQKVTVKYYDIVEEWTVMVQRSDKDVSTDRADAWTRVAWLSGSGTAGADNGFEYKKVDASEWIRVKVDEEDNKESSFTVCLTGLEPETEYVCRAYSNDLVGNEISFTTGVEFQPENSSFENISGTSPILIYGDGQSMWWDTGNHGSTTMSKNVTVPDTEVKHSGKQSLLLHSQFVGIGTIGKFAAGNLFAGKYLKTDGTDGILGWGRPCTSRPTAMRLWVKYIPGTEKKYGTHEGLDGSDKGTVYVAVGDWAGQEGPEGDIWPIVAKTKKSEQNLFYTQKGTYSGDGIIGYGSVVFDSNYDDNGEMKELVIPLDYENFGGYSRVPTHIIIIASASLYGDFFTGYEGSKMWIDDISLEYDY